MQSPQTLNARAEYRGFVASLQQQGLQCANSGHWHTARTTTLRNELKVRFPVIG